MSRFRLALVPLATLALVLAGCAGDDDPDPAASSAATSTDASTAAASGLTVVATTSIIGDIVTEIVGDAAEVEVLMGPGVDPHAFSPSAAQAQSLRESDLVVANGLQLEENLIDTIEAAEEDGVPVVEIAPEVDPLSYEEGDDHNHEGEEDHSEEDGRDHEDEEAHSEEDDHDHGEYDPHVWLDAGRMADAVGVVTTALAEVDDSRDKAEWTEMGEAYAAELRALDDELTEALSAIPEDGRQLVTNHDAYAYWADAYDFEVVDTVIPGNTTQLDTSAGDFAELVETIQDTGVTAIFTESTSSDRLATAVAEEVGDDVEIVQLHSGALDEPGSAAGTYVGLMRTNAQLIVDALSG